MLNPGLKSCGSKMKPDSSHYLLSPLESGQRSTRAVCRSRASGEERASVPVTTHVPVYTPFQYDFFRNMGRGMIWLEMLFKSQFTYPSVCECVLMYVCVHTVIYVL